MADEQPVPWGRDREELTEDSVRAIVSSRFDLPCTSVRKAGEGWDFDVWNVDDVAFRFPKKQQWAEQQRNETRLLELLAPRLPVAVPRPRWIGQAGRDFPFSFAGYPWIDGHGGDVLFPATWRWDDFAARYGRFLRALHSTPVDLAASTGFVAKPDRTRDQLADLEPEIRDVLSPDGFKRAWEAAHAMDSAWPHDSVLAHGDLCPEHWIFSAAGDLVGVIDWCDAAVSDPVGDFVGAWIWFGEEMLQRVLTAYGPVPDADFAARIRARATAKVMIWIGQWKRWPQETSTHDRAAALIPRFMDLMR